MNATVTGRPKPLSLPLEAWPAVDRAAWLAAVQANDDPFADTSPMSGWAASTLADARWSVGRFMAWLADLGVEVGSRSITADVTPEMVATFVRHEQRHKSLRTVASYLRSIVSAFKLFAPDLQWAWAWAIHRRVLRHARQEPRLPRPLAHSRTLMQAGMATILAAEGRHPIDLGQFRNGLCVALLAATPMRIGNYATLRIDHHLVQQGSGWVLSLPPAETKTRRPDIWPVPAALAACIRRYLAEIRPALLAQKRNNKGSDRLWIGDSGGPVGQQTVRRWIKAVTHEGLGVTITPHRFRHAAATTYTLERPSSVVDAAALLGHVSPATTERHYIMQQRQLVQRDYLGLLRLRQAPVPQTGPQRDLDVAPISRQR